jgi:hypothetical protein
MLRRLAGRRAAPVELVVDHDLAAEDDDHAIDLYDDERAFLLVVHPRPYEHHDERAVPPERHRDPLEWPGERRDGKGPRDGL